MLDAKLSDNTKPVKEDKPIPRKPIVLVVDDDKKILDAFAVLMDNENCHMLSAKDVEEALDLSKGLQLDLIITDFMLGTKSSVELFTLLRKQQPKVPVVVITGYPELISEKDVRMFGADYFLTKPLELGKLRQVIRNCCNPLNILS